MKRIIVVITTALLVYGQTFAVINPYISFEGNQSLQNCYLACQNAYIGVQDANLGMLKEAYQYFMSSATIMLPAAAMDSTMLVSTEDRFVYSAEYVKALYQNLDIGSIERGEEVNRSCHVLHGALAANGAVIYHIPNAQQISWLCVWIEPAVDAKVNMQIISPEIYQSAQYDLNSAVCVLECTPNSSELIVQIKISGNDSASFILLTD